MKKLYNFLFVLGIPALFLIFTSGTLFSGGSPGGKSGSPGDGSDCTSCHSGTAVNQEFWISNPTLQTAGYEAGAEYQIFVVGVKEGATRFGFEATAEDGSNNKVGTFAAGGLGQTQLTNSGTAVTHTTAGSFPIMDSTAAWFFTWTAPATTTGEITFYVAVNAANGNGANSGDQINLSSFSTSPSVGISEPENSVEYAIYPNPTAGLLNVKVAAMGIDNNIEILNLNGQLVYKSEIDNEQTKLDLSDLPKGIYFMRLGQETKRFVIH